MARSPGQTTAPGARTATSAEGAASLAVRWVSPRADLPPTHLGARVVVGRGDGCDTVLAGNETSREHAEIVRDGPLFIVNDLGSRNGVFHLGKRVTSAPLSEGDVLRLGEWIGVVVPAHLAPGPALREVAPGVYAGARFGESIEIARRAAASDLPIIVQGETGCGKERVARAIHHFSGLGGPFVAVNCAALPETLAEAELFGHRKGAFTGADRASVGFFRSAEGGTLLLDEILELPLALQAKLLRVLEEREVVPLGEARPVPVKVRVVAAAQQPLSRAVAAGTFRSDLLARLDGVTIELPPLRHRREEVPPLFRRFLATHSGGLAPELEPRLVEALCLYDWPFNVRELDLLARRLLVLHGSERMLKRSHLPEQVRSAVEAATVPDTSPGPGGAAGPAETAEARDERELALLVSALRVHEGNVVKASAHVGISRQRAYRLMQGAPAVDWKEVRGPAGPGRRGQG